MMNNTTISDDLLDIINNPINWSEFSEKTILISGANGFLPAYIVETLLLLLKKNIIKGTKILALVRNIDKAKARFENYLENDKIDLLINIPTNLYSSNNNTNGFIIRRKCIDYNISLITNIKCAKLFVSSLKNYLNGSIKKYSWHDYIL